MNLQIKRLEDDITLIQLDRPECRNAFNTAMLQELNSELESLKVSKSVKTVIFSTTSTTALSAGADIAEQLSAEEGLERMQLFTDLYRGIEELPCPTIAVCVGDVVGAGTELALGCDLRVVGDNIKFRMVGAQHGVPVGVAKLVPLIGLSKAKDLLLTARVVDANECIQLGLSKDVVESGEAEKAAIRTAERIASLPVKAVRQTKSLLREFEGSLDRVLKENDLLMEFQSRGKGLPKE